ncbi:MAG: metal-dependent hydrolase [archaeon]
MLHITHLLMGIGFFILLSPFLGVPITAAGIIIAAISSLIPDIDHPKSFISHWSAFTKILSRSVSSVTTHRGITHTVYGLTAWIVTLGSILNYLGRPIWSPILAGALIGYLSHLVIDSLNPQGVHWFGKEIKSHMKGPINTGGIIEKYGMPLLFAFIIVRYLKL